MTTQNQPRLGQIVKGEHVRGQDCRIIAIHKPERGPAMKDLPPLRIKGECLIEPDDQILYALAPEMAEALQAVRVAAADIACYCQDVRNGLRSGAGLLDLQERFASLNEQARAILARLP